MEALAIASARDKYEPFEEIQWLLERIQTAWRRSTYDLEKPTCPDEFQRLKELIIVRPDFRDLIPPLMAEERLQLECNIQNDGCREPLVIWYRNESELILLDGHNRLEICFEYALPFQVVFMQYPSDQDAWDWLIDNQLGRRNLNTHQRAYLQGKLYRQMQHDHGGDRYVPLSVTYDEQISSGHFDHLKNPTRHTAKTEEKLADAFNTSPRTARRNADYADGVDRLAEQNPALKGQILSGAAPISKFEVQELAHASDEAIKNAAACLTQGKTVGLDRPEPELGEVQLHFDSPEELMKYARKLLKQKKLETLLSSESVEWETPQDLYDVLNSEFGFTLDVCATASNAKCARYFTQAVDGLAQSWEVEAPDAVWMNPPYGKGIDKWMAKALSTALSGLATVVCLVPAKTDTVWWWDWARWGEVRFIKGRLTFGDADNTATFMSAVVIFRRGLASASGYIPIQPTTHYWDWKKNAQADWPAKDLTGLINPTHRQRFGAGHPWYAGQHFERQDDGLWAPVRQV